MIGGNPSHHAEDDDPPPQYDGDLEERMPGNYRRQLEELKKSPEGRKALARYKKFWGIPFPTEIRTVEVPGPKNKKMYLVGMGVSPEVHISEGKKKSPGKRKVRKGKRIAATTADGKRIVILSGKDSKATKQELKRLGFAPETHYVPTNQMEDAGTFKKGKYWVHLHSDEGGEYPPLYEDQAGNFWYGPGTYSVDKWIRR